MWIFCGLVDDIHCMDVFALVFLWIVRHFIDRQIFCELINVPL